MELGILHNSPPSTKRGCRAGRLHRLWHGLPPAPWPCTRSQHHSVPSRNLHPLMVPPFLQPHPDLQSAVGNAPFSSKHPAQLPTTDCLLSIISPMGGQPSDAPALSPPSPLQQGGQSSNAPALSPPSPLPQGGQPIALALSPPSPPPQGGQPSDAPGLSPSSSTLLLCPSDSTLNICHLNSQSAVKTGRISNDSIVQVYHFLFTSFSSLIYRPIVCELHADRGSVALTQKEAKPSPPCPLLDSHRSSCLQTAAAMVKEGKVVGVPTDTVYALAASCSKPQSIRRLYHVKGRPAEKPICLCLASLDQLEAVDPPFSPLLWDFMRRCYPGGISCVLPKDDGAWLQRLGLGESANLLGNEVSICLRVPDCGPLAYMVTMAGPVAVTSANISGGEDSIHHDMVIDTLGERIDAMVCDGKSRQLAPSTVVNCIKIDEGVITYFREGCTPIEQVERHFREAKEAMAKKGSNSLPDSTNKKQ
ncbi:hypothetical protein ACOMHN_011661 [Nucella lapillus]